MNELSGKQRRYLRGMGHSLSPHVHVNEISPSLLTEADRQLQTHELIKVKLLLTDRIERRETLRRIAEETGAQVVQELGKTALLYRPDPDAKNPIRLP